MKINPVTAAVLCVLSLVMIAMGIMIGSEWGSIEDDDFLGPPRESPVDENDTEQVSDRTRPVNSKPSRSRVAASELPSSTEVPLFSDALMTHFRVEYEKAWSAEREEAISEEQWTSEIARFKAHVLSIPGTMGSHKGRAANERDRINSGIEAGDQSAILEAIASGHWKPDDETFGAELMDRVLEQQVVGDSEAGPSFQRDRQRRATKGLTLFFPAGIHKLDSRRLKENGRQIPEDITITGTGMNQTLLQLTEMDSRGAVKRLRIQNMTLDMGNDYFIDLRGNNSLSFEMTRTRLVRFDMGAGGSLAFSVGGGAIIRATDCEFLGGYGRNPGSGNLYRGKPGWMHFIRCRFSLLNLNLGSADAVRFDDCNFDTLRRDPRIRFPKFFRGGSFTPLADPPGFHGRKPISLSTLFPNFK